MSWNYKKQATLKKKLLLSNSSRNVDLREYAKQTNFNHCCGYQPNYYFLFGTILNLGYKYIANSVILKLLQKKTIKIVDDKYEFNFT